MATVNAVSIPKTDTLDMASVSMVQWTPLANGDAGSWVALSNFSDRSIQVNGTFGAGGNVVIEGSNLPTPSTAFFTLNDPFNASLGTITSGKITGIIEAVRWIRPRVSAGDGTTSLTVTLFARGNIKV